MRMTIDGSGDELIQMQGVEHAVSPMKMAVNLLLRAKMTTTRASTVIATKRTIWTTWTRLSRVVTRKTPTKEKEEEEKREAEREKRQRRRGTASERRPARR